MRTVRAIFIRGVWRCLHSGLHGQFAFLLTNTILIFMKKFLLTIAAVLFATASFAETVIYRNATIYMTNGSTREANITNITEDSVVCYLWVQNAVAYSPKLTSLPANRIEKIMIDKKTTYLVNKDGKLYQQKTLPSKEIVEQQEMNNDVQYVAKDNYYTSIDLIPAESKVAPNGIVVCKKGKYYYNGEWLEPQIYADFLKQNCNTAYAYYKSAERMRNAGIGVFAAGGVISLLVGVPMLTYTGQDSNVDPLGVQVTGKILLTFGALSFIPGVTCWTLGSLRMHKSAKIYNTYASQKHSNVLLSFNASPASMGCKINF